MGLVFRVPKEGRIRAGILQVIKPMLMIEVAIAMQVTFAYCGPATVWDKSQWKTG
ncbi:hypothetical protein MCEMSHM24_03143 [Comamonadaceae bacterium]|jgi:hypothetical protein